MKIFYKNKKKKKKEKKKKKRENLKPKMAGMMGFKKIKSLKKNF